MPAANVPTALDQNWDRTLDHLSAIDRHDADANALNDVSLARKRSRRRPRQLRPSSR
jgi:hypothetical protein